MDTTAGAGEDVKRLIAADNDLGFKLLSQLARDGADGNLFISSFSVAAALAMTYNGARGETRVALAEALGVTGLSLQRVNQANAALMAFDEGLGRGVQLAIANSIWIQERLGVSPDFVRSIATYYAGKVAGLDFSSPGAADTINAWVADKTRQKIRQLVTPEIVRPALLILINAIYFKGSWSGPFDRRRTRDQLFSTGGHLAAGARTRVAMMRRSGNYAYYQDEDLQAVSLPYEGGRFSMVVVLPGPSSSIGELRQHLSATTWRRWMSRLHSRDGEVALPRFKIEYGEDLLPSLTALYGDAVSALDFAGMGAGSLMISNVIHKTVLEVNEEGTEAAAATAVNLIRGPPPSPFKMVVDRPFLCAIRDQVTGLVLFMGQVLKPGQAPEGQTWA